MKNLETVAIQQHLDPGVSGRRTTCCLLSFDSELAYFYSQLRFFDSFSFQKSTISKVQMPFHSTHFVSYSLYSTNYQNMHCCFRYYNTSILLQWLLPIRRFKHGSLECSKVFAAPPYSALTHAANNWTQVKFSYKGFTNSKITFMACKRVLQPMALTNFLQ